MSGVAAQLSGLAEDECKRGSVRETWDLRDVFLSNWGFESLPCPPLGATEPRWITEELCGVDRFPRSPSERNYGGPTPS